MRSDRLYLTDIVAAADAIGRFIAEVDDEDSFYNDDLYQSAILQKLIVIGEAASRLRQDFRSEHPEIEWADISGFRNIAVHAYFSVKWEIVWITATEDVPRLREQVTRILAELPEE